MAAPESPLYLVSKSEDKQALKVLHYLRRKTSEDHQKELEEIKKHLNDLKLGTFLDIFRTRASIKALVYSILLTNFQQFSGINVITFFTQNIFNATGSTISPEICCIIVGTVQFFASFGTPLCADRFGRRKLLLTVVPGAAIAEIVLGVYFFLQKNGDDVSSVGWLPIVSMRI
ncbi:Sugar tr domain containing protein [Asbolus verrucosus]|uniref:Sugar tr domain containing protein n=1 Tax=Asbolus verrucosus TaxID=1661398 RepID=A0A482W0Q8_ASBVE|nr:Sugar tr domain containing protein [Asbolus verrucosus]